MRTVERAWQDLGSAGLAGVPPAVHAWLRLRGSMTQALAWDGVRPTVRVWRQTTHGRVWPDEAALLGRRAGPAWVREVSLHHGSTAVLVARTVALAPTLRRARVLQHLGTRPLGELLFGQGAAPHPWVRQAALLSPGSPTLRHLLRRAAPHPYPACWARRTVYGLEQCPLLVTELFLPALWRAARARQAGAPITDAMLRDNAAS